MFNVVESVGSFYQNFNQYIFFFKGAISFTNLAMISKTIGLAHKLLRTYYGNAVNKIFFFQYVFYKTDGIFCCVQESFYLCNGLAFCSEYKTGKKENTKKFFHALNLMGKDKAWMSGHCKHRLRFFCYAGSFYCKIICSGLTPRILFISKHIIP
jgi:hypothetical protein